MVQSTSRLIAGIQPGGYLPPLSSPLLVSLVACSLPDHLIQAVVQKLQRLNVVCDLIYPESQDDATLTASIRKSVQQTGFLLIIDADAIGRQAGRLLELAREEAVGYYLTHPPKLILLQKPADNPRLTEEHLYQQMLRDTYDCI